jgi:hypothetical protein
MIMQMQINATPSLLRCPSLPKDFRHLMQFLSNAHIDAEMSVKLTCRHIYNASAPSATRPSKPAKVAVRAAPPSDSWTSCASPVGAAVEPRVEEEVVMLAVLLPEAWWEAEEAMAAVPEVAEDIMLESVMVMLMEESEVSLDIMELAVEDAMDDAAEEELGVLLSEAMTKGGV